MTRDQKVEKIGEFFKRIHHTHDELLLFWKQHTLFHWDWWVSLIVAIACWVVFIMFRKKDSTARLLFVAFYALIVNSWLNFVGVTAGLWYYVGEIYPSLPAYFTWDFSLFPVYIALLIQYKPHIHPVWKSLFFAVTSAFVGEQLLIWGKFFIMENWHSVYSVPFYVAIYLTSHWISKMKTFAPVN